MARLGPAYAPRRPEETALHAIVREHLTSFLADAAEHHEGGPKYVEREFRAYLKCGIFAHGFARAHCDDCGHDLLVALRRLAAFRAEVLSALCRIFVQEIFASHRRRVSIASAESGAVTFVQRFGSSLNLNVHFHVVVLDGVFTCAGGGGGVAFHGAGPCARGVPHDRAANAEPTRSQPRERGPAPLNQLRSVRPLRFAWRFGRSFDPAFSKRAAEAALADMNASVEISSRSASK